MPHLEYTYTVVVSYDKLYMMIALTYFFDVMSIII